MTNTKANYSQPLQAMCSISINYYEHTTISVLLVNTENKQQQHIKMWQKKHLSSEPQIQKSRDI